MQLRLKEKGEMYSVWGVQYADRVEEVHQALESTPLAYEQKNVDGELVLVLFGKGSYEGKEFYTQQPFLRQRGGSFRPGPPTMSKMEGHVSEAILVEMIVPVETAWPTKQST